MTAFRLRPLDWKETADGFVAHTVFGPITIKVNDGDVTYETWFFDKPHKYEATTVQHAKADARVKFLEALQPALEIVPDGPSEQATALFNEPSGTVTNPAPVWDGKNP